MELNANFNAPVKVHTGDLAWQPSPMAGVDRRMLDRVGAEVSRATSIVRYAKGSAFAEHTHSGGEEFIVLDGVFQDEHGDYPAGTYIRNPVGTHHIPRSDPGCTIFVKLWQFDPDDQEQLAIDLAAMPMAPDPGRPGVQRADLAIRDYERVAVERWDGGTEIELSDEGGNEILILDGELCHLGDVYGKHDWLRWPAGESLKVTAGPPGAHLWIKRGHLREIRVPPQG